MYQHDKMPMWHTVKRAHISVMRRKRLLSLGRPNHPLAFGLAGQVELLAARAVIDRLCARLGLSNTRPRNVWGLACAKSTRSNRCSSA